MGNIIQKIAEYLPLNFGKIISFLLLFYIINIALTIYIINSFTVWVIAILILAPPIIFELTVRFIMYFAYGPHYVYSIVSYFLIDHPVYGSCFRKGCSSKNIDFLVFDKFAFVAGTSRILSLAESKEKRVDFNINSLGYRGREFLSNKKNARLRIFCSGGSTTACDYNDDEQTWPTQLQACLKEKGFDVEVINAGVQGWYSYQELLRFKNEICRYKADIVLIHQGWNEEFEFSSLSLGTKWKPKIARNVREQNNLFCPKNKYLSSISILSFYMAIQSYLKNCVFIPKMRFTNSERWNVLKESDYILAWYDNMVDMAELCLENNIMAYTIDYPGLVNLGDSLSDRSLYLQGSRLTPLFADYQAISKKRISRTLKEIKEIIPCLNVDDDFLKYTGMDRLKLFHDEIHMTPEGNRLLAEAICYKLVQDKNFKRRYDSKRTDERINSVNLDQGRVQEALNVLNHNRPYINRLIDKKIDELQDVKKSGAGVNSEIPEDRYTTF